jgi:hypothetical protein
MSGLEQGLIVAVVLIAGFALSQYVQRRRKK